MIRLLPIVFFLIIIGNSISPINSFEPINVEGGSKETSVFSYSEVEDQLTPRELNINQEISNDPTENIDSMSIWREWFGNGYDDDTEYKK